MECAGFSFLQKLVGKGLPEKVEKKNIEKVNVEKENVKYDKRCQ